MNRQDRFRARYARLRDGWLDSVALYGRVVDGLTGPETRILDVGCGHSDTLRSMYARAPLTVGLDTDVHSLRANDAVADRVAGSAAAIPLRDATFDLLLAAWLFEHLDRPRRAFREMYRVLRPGGRLIFLTPNAWNYNTWPIRLIPNALHPPLVEALYGRPHEETGPTRYRANTPAALDRLLLPLGFRRSQVILNGDPTYIAFNRALFRLAVLLERALDWKPLNFARVHLIGVYEKVR